MKKYFRRRSLKKVEKEKKSLSYHGLSNSEQALILFRNDTAHKTIMVELLEKLLNNYSISAETLGFVPVKLKKDEEPVKGYYYESQLNWIGNPKQEVVQELTQKKYDVVIDVDQSEKTPNTFILLKVSAGLRVGFTDSKPHYDLVLNQKDHQPQELIQQLEHYLNSIEKQ